MIVDDLASRLADRECGRVLHLRRAAVGSEQAGAHRRPTPTSLFETLPGAIHD
jgi:hypothetical protein